MHTDNNALVLDTAPREAEIDISVVLPCLNEEMAIAKVVEKAFRGISACGMTGEVLVVDNGSTDRSVEEARKAGARVIIETNRGYGSALRRGFREGRGKYLVMADADDTYPVEDLKPFIATLEKGYDYVNGDRFGGRIEKGAMTWSHQYIGTPVLSWILRTITRTPLTDSQCGMRAFRREAIQSLDLRAPGMEFATEMLVQASRANLRITQLPITLTPRIGESKLETLPDGWRHLRYLMLVSPGHLFLAPGALLFVLGILALVLKAILPNGVMLGHAVWNPDYAPVVITAVGFQGIWLGILAKLYYLGVGMLREDRIANRFRRMFHLERWLIGSALLAVLGIGLEAVLLLQQLNIVHPHAWLAVTAAVITSIGIQSFFNSFVAYLLSSDYTRPLSIPQTIPTSQMIAYPTSSPRNAESAESGSRGANTAA